MVSPRKQNRYVLIKLLSVAELHNFQELRYLGCELIQQGAILLKLPQTAAATGQILFQRYYYQKSFVRYHFEVSENKFLEFVH